MPIRPSRRLTGVEKVTPSREKATAMHAAGGALTGKMASRDPRLSPSSLVATGFASSHS